MKDEPAIRQRMPHLMLLPPLSFILHPSDRPFPLRCRVAIIVNAVDRVRRTCAAALAQELGVPVIDTLEHAVTSADLLLVVGERRLELQESGVRSARPVFVDFTGGRAGRSRRSPPSRRQPIALALGLRHGPITVVDATAGLGRDSFLLATLGCTVIAVERCAVLGALLRDALARAAAAGSTSPNKVLARVSLVIDDSRRALSRMVGEAAPDAVYLDPMYPPRRKAALPKKELRICRRLVGDDEDAGELLAIARQVARRRVVVKRHPHAPPLAPDPALQFAGKMTRYDVYLSPRQGGA